MHIQMVTGVLLDLLLNSSKNFRTMIIFRGRRQMIRPYLISRVFCLLLRLDIRARLAHILGPENVIDRLGSWTFVEVHRRHSHRIDERCRATIGFTVWHRQNVLLQIPGSKNAPMS
jgi:hypothetical protein